MDEDGKYVGNKRAWTGTSTSGLRTGDYCAGWTSAETPVTATKGVVNDTDTDWTEDWDATCSSSSGRLYCFSQIATAVFFDGFESSGSTAWSSSIGEQ